MKYLLKIIKKHIFLNYNISSSICGHYVIICKHPYKLAYCDYCAVVLKTVINKFVLLPCIYYFQIYSGVTIQILHYILKCKIIEISNGIYNQLFYSKLIFKNKFLCKHNLHLHLHKIIFIL